MKRRRNNIVIDNGKEELTDRHLRSMKRDTSDIVMDVPSLSAWPRDKCATSTCCAADIYNTEREYNYDVIHPDLQKRLTTQQLLARPCIGNDGGLAPELLALWKRNTCKVTGRAGTQLPFRMRCRRSQRRRRRRRAEPSPKLKYGQRIMVPPAVGEQPIKAVVNSILPDDMYRVDYLDDNRYWGPKVWSYSQLIVGWPNEEDDAVDADEEEPTQFYRHQYRSKKYKHKVRQVQIDEEQDPDYTGFKVLRGGHDFDIARILEQSATDTSEGRAAATRFREEVRWQEGSTVSGIVLNLSNIGVGPKRVLRFRGHDYKVIGSIGDEAEVNAKCISKSKRCGWNCEATLKHDRLEGTVEIGNASHHPACQVMRFLEEEGYTHEQRQAVVLAYVNYWERIYDPDHDSVLVRNYCTVFFLFLDSNHAKTYHSSQLFLI